MEKAMDQPDFEVLVLEPALCRTRVPGTLNLIRGLNRWHGASDSDDNLWQKNSTRSSGSPRSWLNR
jgi:hypothetical protein